MGWTKLNVYPYAFSEANDRIANLERQLREAQINNKKLLNEINKIKGKSKRNEKGKEEDKDAKGIFQSVTKPLLLCNLHV